MDVSNWIIHDTILYPRLKWWSSDVKSMGSKNIDVSVGGWGVSSMLISKLEV